MAMLTPAQNPRGVGKNDLHVRFSSLGSSLYPNRPGGFLPTAPARRCENDIATREQAREWR